MAKTNIAEFISQVRQETSRVTWPTRRETMVSTLVVLVMVVVVALFFLLVDGIIYNAVQFILGL